MCIDEDIIVGLVEELKNPYFYTSVSTYSSGQEEKMEKMENIKLSKEEMEKLDIHRTIYFLFFKSIPIEELHKIIDELKEVLGDLIENKNNLTEEKEHYVFRVSYGYKLHFWDRIK